MNYIYDSDPNKVYFINSSSDAYTITLLQNTLFFGFVKLIHFIFYLLQKKNKIFKMIYNKIRDNCKWWTFLVTVFEVNMVSLVFSSALQINLPSFFLFSNKANFVFMIAILFILVFYSLCFYNLVAKFESFQVAGVLLQRSL